MTQGTQSRCSVMTWKDRVGKELAGGCCGLGGRGHMYAYGHFMFMYGKNHHNTVSILQLNK